MAVVVVLGGVNMDFIIEAPTIAARGETREGTRFYTTPGGKGANQAVAAARNLDNRIPVEMAGTLGFSCIMFRRRLLKRTQLINVTVNYGMGSGYREIPLRKLQ